MKDLSKEITEMKNINEKFNIIVDKNINERSINEINGLISYLKKNRISSSSSSTSKKKYLEKKNN